ncbi:MAG: M23 family metallopeptidase [Synechococcales bacterium]|nr:M23 family metallopeptidase [Synechococcales bacterium]
MSSLMNQRRILAIAQRRFLKPSPTQRTLLKRLFLVGLSLLTLLGVYWGGQPLISATEATQYATGNVWRGASFPVENFQGYTSPFGYRQSPDGSGGTQFHRGLDMAAPEGSYIRNWWTGRVVEVSDNSACGTSVVIESGEWEHIYCHMQGFSSRDAQGKFMLDREGGLKIYEGQMIPAGARIGRVGMTGRTTGPHLHWGLKYARQWVDPALVLRAMYAEQRSPNISAR